MRILITLIFALTVRSVLAQGNYPGSVGSLGTTAIFKDSTIIKSWASSCVGTRGFIDIANKNLGVVNNGTSDYTLGKSDPKVLSLGDSGVATVSYNGFVFNGIGPDFCVFENSFNDEFLELAFVEVSSDGINFHRFSSFSETDTAVQKGSFDLIDASNIHNLAGKYKGQYGTPFDLEDLKNTVGLNIDSVTHIRVVDVVGSIDTAYASRDSKGRIINDPYPTDFKNGDWYTGGFDLEAVGLINYTGEIFLSDFSLNNNTEKISIYPNPAQNVLNLRGVSGESKVILITASGSRTEIEFESSNSLNISNLVSGIYIIEFQDEGNISRKKFIKL